MSGLELLNPWALALLGGLPLLLFAYRRQSDKRAVELPSLIVLRRLTKVQPPRQRFKPPWTALLELLALLAIVGAATLPLWGEGPGDVALLIDNSLSSIRSVENTKLFELVKKQALKELEAYPSRTRFSLYVTSPEAQLVGAEALDRSAIEGALANLTVSLSADNLERAVSQITTSKTGQKSYDELLIVTDRRVSLVSAETPSKQSKTTKIRIAEAELPRLVDNLYLSPFRIVDAGPGNPRRLLGEIYAGASAPREVVLRLSGSASPDADTLETLDSVRLDFDSGLSTAAEFTLPTAANHFRLFKVEIVSPLGGNSNNIREDDSSWVSTDSPGSAKLLVVSAPTPEETAPTFGLERLRQFSVRHVTPEQYTLKSSDELRENALIVFHQTAPTIPPKVPALLIAPPRENTLFPTAGGGAQLTISSWKEEHPILSYLRVPLLEVTSGEMFRTPAWATSIINSQQGSILSAGEARGIRLAAVGFELLPFEGASTPTTSILTLNIVRWLTKREILGDSALVGSEITLNSDQTLVVSDPKKIITTVEATANSSANNAAENRTAAWRYALPGPHLISVISGSDANSIDNQNRLVAANVFFPEESGVSAAVTLPTLVSHELPVAEKSIGDIWYWCGLVALLLILLEFISRIFIAPRLAAKEVLSN